MYAMRIFRLDEEDTRLTLLKELHALMRCKDRAVLELEDAFLVPPARSPPPRERVHGRAPGPCVVLIKEPFLGSLREVGNGGALPVAVAAKDATRTGSWRLFHQRSLQHSRMGLGFTVGLHLPRVDTSCLHCIQATVSAPQKCQRRERETWDCARWLSERGVGFMARELYLKNPTPPGAAH